MGKGAENMPKLLHARVRRDMAEEQKVRKLANRAVTLPATG
jgi:hypothetical protein